MLSIRFHLFGLLVGLPLLCQCSATLVNRAWSAYDPLGTPPAETSARLDSESARLESRLLSHPNDLRALASLADLRFLQNREREAVELYRKYLSSCRRPASPERRARFGTALLHLEQNGEARAVLEQVLREDPENARALLSYAEYQADIAGDSAYAMALLQRAKDTGEIFIPPDFEQALIHDLN
jgi:cytochrome c-type biogenesis protein CcmH/NrfG